MKRSLMAFTLTIAAMATIGSVLAQPLSGDPANPTGRKPGSGLTPPTTPQPGSTYRYVPWWYYRGGYPRPFYGPYYYPGPVFVPPEALYGPDAVKRFLGASPVAATPPPTDDVNPRPRTPFREQGGSGGDPKPKAVTRNAELIAKRFLSLGDHNFANQRYVEAYERYKSAGDAAPNMAEPAFRAGWALIASGRYDLAAKAFKRGLTTDAGWPGSAFSLAELYATHAADKAAHLDTLARAAEADAQNGDLLFLIGVSLYFDGQRDRATPFFQRAAQLAPDPDYLKPFLATAAAK